MLKKLRERIKRIPVVGQLVHNLYLVLRYRKGEVLTVQDGYLRGMKLQRFMRSVRKRYVQGNHEQELQYAIVRELKSGQVFYEVGAHGGFFSLLAAMIVGESGRVVAFEPHPETARQLKKRLTLNTISNCRIVVVAVADKAGVAEFANDISADMLSLVELLPDGSAEHTIRVDTTTLDEQIRKRGVPDVIKIDIEDAELLALRGADRLLREHQPVLFVEIHNATLSEEFYPLIESYGYRSYRLSGEPITDRTYHRFVMSKKGESPLGGCSSHDTRYDPAPGGAGARETFQSPVRGLWYGQK